MTWLHITKKIFLKLLFALVSIIAAVHIFRLLLLPGLQGIFQLDEASTSAFRRIGIFLCVLIAYWAYVRYYEKRPVKELRVTPVGIAVGTLSGALIVAIAVVPLFVFGVYEVKLYRGPQQALLGVAVLIVIAAFFEEVVYRGVVFQALEEGIGTNRAMWLQSLIFSAAHIGNNAGAGLLEEVWSFACCTLIGAFWTCIYIRTRNLWLITAHHAAWNYAIILTGTPLSGIDQWRSAAPFESSVNGPLWLSGGAFGPENSIVTITIVALCVAVLIRTHQAKLISATR
jgi:uncharacterized protein